jgi:hypothetical protein
VAVNNLLTLSFFLFKVAEVTVVEVEATKVEAVVTKVEEEATRAVVDREVTAKEDMAEAKVRPRSLLLIIHNGNRFHL